MRRSITLLLAARAMSASLPPLNHARILSRAQMQSLLNRVAENNNLGDLRLPTFNPASHGDDPSADTLIPFVLDDCTHGYVTPAFAAHCCRFPSVFFLKSFVGLCLVPAVAAGSLQQRTASVAAVTAALRDEGVITGWRDELLATGPNGGFVLPPASAREAEGEEEDGGGAALLMERAAFPHFGLKGYGVHVNGYVHTPDGPKLWVATRAQSKQTWPGAYDHIAAGALPYDLSPIDNVIKECGEEAGIPPALAAAAMAVGAVSYRGVDEDGRLKRDCLFCFDLPLPHSFQPVPVDGEVACFELRPLDWVIDCLVDDGAAAAAGAAAGAAAAAGAGGGGGRVGVGRWDGRYKPNCNLVVIDFLLRHGAISPSSPLYLQLAASLRGGECY